MGLVLSLDLGTTGNRAIAFSSSGRPVAQSYQEIQQLYPEPAWVEQSPQEIWATTQRVFNDVLAQVNGQSIDAIGITNQRETTILWDAATGEPVYNAIV